MSFNTIDLVLYNNTTVLLTIANQELSWMNIALINVNGMHI